MKKGLSSGRHGTVPKLKMKGKAIGDTAGGGSMKMKSMPRHGQTTKVSAPRGTGGS